MNRIADLGPLLDAGITSFKIEGRLKDATYVTTVVSAYRRALDDVLLQRASQAPPATADGPRRSSSGRSESPVVPDISKAYNRGFTSYFLHGRGESPGTIDTPKMIGEYLSSVVDVSAESFVVDSRTQVSNGDGLAFFGVSGELTGTVVNGSRRTRRGLEITPNSLSGIVAGQAIYHNRSHSQSHSTSWTTPGTGIDCTFATLTIPTAAEWISSTDSGHVKSRRLPPSLRLSKGGNLTSRRSLFVR